MLELSFRQSLAMSAGDYAIFVTRPITAVMLGIGLTLLLLGMRSVFTREANSPASTGLETAAGQERKENP